MALLPLMRADTEMHPSSSIGGHVQQWETHTGIPLHGGLPK
jgi:hypothetical protein